MKSHGLVYATDRRFPFAPASPCRALNLLLPLRSSVRHAIQMEKRERGYWTRLDTALRLVLSWIAGYCIFCDAAPTTAAPEPIIAERVDREVDIWGYVSGNPGWFHAYQTLGSG
jgi:hypothetical protein